MEQAQAGRMRCPACGRGRPIDVAFDGVGDPTPDAPEPRPVGGAA